ncbi:MAG: hypothetical protein KDE58_37050, partial [Caldilineaceae bacterium]|nr:hypothetical protein [Caldilineaceae bacterium]
MLSLQPITLADLLLSRLLFAGVQGMTTSTLKQSLKAVAGSELSNAAYTEQMNHALAALAERNYVRQIRRARYQMTDDGQQNICNQLGVKAVPTRLRWHTFKNADLVAHALRLPALANDTRQQIANADGLRAAILKHYYELPVDNFVTLTEARNALLWQQLCDPKTATHLQERLPTLRRQTFNQGTVMSALLNDLLQASKPLPWEKALPQLIAKITNAKRTAPDELRNAILRQALVTPATATNKDTSTPPVNGTNPGAEPRPVVLSDSEFARITKEAATATEGGRLGDYKVFISRVWETMQQQHPDLQLSLAEFKQRLIAANQQRLLTLSRADMAYALDPEDV